MAKVSWTVALVVALACSAVASAQTPPATSSAQPVAVAAPAAAVPTAATETASPIDLARIFAAPNAPAISTMPEPKLASCTLLECKAPCRVPGCFAECLDITTCTCDTICN